MDLDVRTRPLARRAAQIGRVVAGPVSDEVDRYARFPGEAVQAMRDELLLSAFVPTDLGGEGASLEEAAHAVTALGRHCASTAMVYAMHLMQLACLVRHGRSDYLVEYARELARHQWLLASATTEAGVGGDVRTSICALERSDGRFRLRKEAPVISYGAQADAVLTTARRDPDSPPSDQVLVLCRPPGLKLDPVGEWDTLGFRGTCSLGFFLVAEGEEECILDDPFGDVASETMLPVSHILWASVWLGIASAAIDLARRHVQSDARKHPGVVSAPATRLAELSTVHQQMTELVRGGIRRYESVRDDPAALSGMGFAVHMNNLKISTSRLVVDIVGSAMTICGMAAYRQDSPYSMGRLLRDAHGAALMVNNDRILANNAQLLLATRDEDD